MSLHAIKLLYETSGGAPYWSLERMQVFMRFDIGFTLQTQKLRLYFIVSDLNTWFYVKITEKMKFETMFTQCI